MHMAQRWHPGSLAEALLIWVELVWGFYKNGAVLPSA